jgi:hypothetical protein
VAGSGCAGVIQLTAQVFRGREFGSAGAYLGGRGVPGATGVFLEKRSMPSRRILSENSSSSEVRRQRHGDPSRARAPDRPSVTNCATVRHSEAHPPRRVPLRRALYVWGVFLLCSPCRRARQPRPAPPCHWNLAIATLQNRFAKTGNLPCLGGRHCEPDHTSAHSDALR